MTLYDEIKRQVEDCEAKAIKFHPTYGNYIAFETLELSLVQAKELLTLIESHERLKKENERAVRLFVVCDCCEGEFELPAITSPAGTSFAGEARCSHCGTINRVWVHAAMSTRKGSE